MRSCAPASASGAFPKQHRGGQHYQPQSMRATGGARSCAPGSASFRLPNPGILCGTTQCRVADGAWRRQHGTELLCAPALASGVFPRQHRGGNTAGRRACVPRAALGIAPGDRRFLLADPRGLMRQGAMRASRTTAGLPLSPADMETKAASAPSSSSSAPSPPSPGPSKPSRASTAAAWSPDAGTVALIVPKMLFPSCAAERESWFAPFGEIDGLATRIVECTVGTFYFCLQAKVRFILVDMSYSIRSSIIVYIYFELSRLPHHIV